MEQSIFRPAGTGGRVRAADRLGLAPSELVILSLIGYPGPLTPTELSLILGRNASTITAAIDRLESAGMIVRRPHLHDRRKTILEMSPGGERALNWIRSFSVDAFSGLDPATLADMADTFNGTAAAIETQESRLEVQPLGSVGDGPRV